MAATDALTTYLNDHLAGSVAAIELLEALASDGRGTPLEQRLDRMIADIREDQYVLRDILARVGGEESRVKQASAWIGEKLGRAKLRLGGENEALGRLESLEALALGVQGKLGLWRTLGALKARDPRLGAYRFDELEQRALAQYRLLEEERLAAASAALVPPQ